MESKDRDTILSRLARRWEKWAGHKDESAEAQPEQERLPPEAEAPPKPTELRLPPEHPLQQLWSVYFSQLPPPALFLDTPMLPPEAFHSSDGSSSTAPLPTAEEAAMLVKEPVPLLTEEELRQELERLEHFVSGSANSRLAAIRALPMESSKRDDTQGGAESAALENESANASERSDETAPQAERPPEEDIAKEERPSTENTSEEAASEEEPPKESGLDAQALVFLTANRITAWLLIYPPVGSGAEVTREMLENALSKQNITYGVNQELLNELPASSQRYFHLVLAAYGRPPIHGKNGSIMDLFSRNASRTLVEDESGKVDYASIELFQNVKKGDVICHIIPPSPRLDGVKVDGKIAQARPGQPAQVPKGRNTALSEDQRKLVASCDGHLEFSGRSFQVKPVMEIGGNVDFSTGNINCLGDVHIHGDVCSGFTVRATGSITVDGVIEACIVEAGADLIVRKGVQGNNQAVLRAHRNVYAKYLESSSVHARENLETECIVNCDVYSDGSVTVRSGRGAIIGGKIRAAKEVIANSVGARSECLTTIILGGNPCEAFDRANLVRENADMEKALEKLDRQPDSPAKLRQMSKLRMQISVGKLKLQQLDKELAKQEKERAASEQEEALPVPCQLRSRVVYPGTEITIGSVTTRVAQETRSCHAFLKGEEISLI